MNADLQVELVLAHGSRAGTRAGIHRGFYMIGRHSECQIRPKSRSVSRRHCLIEHQSTGDVRVLDLGSSSGTKLNGCRLVPMQWHDISDSDELRCGKVAFNFEIRPVKVATGSAVSVGAESSPDAQDVESKASQSGPTMVTGDAWQEFDIASFLESQDDADRERRYENIRRQSTEAQEKDSEELDIDDVATVSGDADPVLDLATAERGKGQQGAKNGTPNKGAEAKPGRLPGNRTKSTSSNPRWFDNDDRVKLIVAVMLAIVVLGFFAYQFMQFSSGPEIRIIEGID